MAMIWRPSPASLLERFAELVPDDPRVERRQMFGYPCAFLGGNLFTGLFQDRMMLRLPEEARGEFLKLAGAAPFEPMPGRPMREYVVVPTDLIVDTPRIGAWLARALAFAATLPVKQPKGKAKTGAKAESKPMGARPAGRKSARKAIPRKAAQTRKAVKTAQAAKRKGRVSSASRGGKAATGKPAPRKAAGKPKRRSAKGKPRR